MKPITIHLWQIADGRWLWAESHQPRVHGPHVNSAHTMRTIIMAIQRWTARYGEPVDITIRDGPPGSDGPIYRRYSEHVPAAASATDDAIAMAGLIAALIVLGAVVLYFKQFA